MQFMNSFLLAGPKCSFEANETLYSCSPGRGKASGERGNLGKKRKKTSSTRMPFDQRAANEAEMPFQYAIGHSRDFWSYFLCIFWPTGRDWQLNYSV